MRIMHLLTRPDGRYYVIEPPSLDLLGDEVIVTYHGSSLNRLGGIHSYLARETSIEQLIRIRQRHGYVVA